MSIANKIFSIKDHVEDIYDTLDKTGYIYKLPEEYTQVDYIESNGTQYIDTGAKIFNSNQHELVFDIMPTEFYNYNQLFGSTYDADKFEGWIYASGQMNGRYKSQDYSSTRPYLQLNKRYKIDFIKDTDYGMLKIDGEEIGRNTNMRTFTELTDATLILFKSGTDYSKLKIYGCKVYENVTLIRDFIPCYRNIDNKVGLYDLVNNVFYINVGTGEFTYGAIDRQLKIPNKNIENINYTLKEQLKYYLINGLDIVWDNWEKVLGSSENTFTLNNVVQAPMKIELKGNTYQYSTSGKNLLNTTATTQTKNGVTFTKNNDGSWNVNGTATEYTSISLGTVNLTANTTYTLSGGGLGGSYLVQILNGETNPSTANGGYATFTQTNTYTATIYIVVYGQKTFNNILLKPMIELGSSVSAYEPYTGGIASPNPDYPQDIQVVSGDNRIEICNKNLFDKNREIYSSYISSIATALSNFKSTGQYAKGYINYTTSLINNDNRFQTVFINCMENTTYTISFSSNKEISTLCYLDNEGNIVGYGKNYWSTFTTFTFTTAQNSKYIVIGVQSTDIDTLQVEIGNATEYITNQHQTHLISFPVENLFNKNNPNVLNAYINASGVITSENSNRTIWLKINQNTNYAFQMTQKALSTATSTDDIRIALFTNQPAINSTGTIVYSQARATSTSDYYFEYSFNSGNNSYVAIKILNVSKTDYDSSIDTLQIEKGSKANHYTSFGTTPIELCKIGTYQDKIAKSTGKNLFDKDSMTWVRNNNDNPTDTSNTNVSRIRTQTLMKLEGGKTYTISGIPNGVQSTPYVKFYASSTSTTKTSGENGSTFTVPSNAPYVIFQFSGENFTDATNLLMKNANIQLEKGNQATSYEPYGTSWYIEKKIGKVVLNGSESANWRKSGTYQGSFYGDTIPTGATIDYGDLYCNYFKRANINNSSQISSNYTRGTCFIEFGSYGTMDFWYDDGTATLEQWKTWLSNNNPIVYYPLATPTYTEITDSTLLSQLNALGNANSYNNQTNISQTNNILSFEIDAIALKNI